MGVLHWMVLVVLLSAGTGRSAVNVNWLTDVIKTLTTEYDIKGQFSLAANIPMNRDQPALEQILKNHPYKGAESNTLQEGDMHNIPHAVSDALKNDEVYKSNDIIVAKPTKGGVVHAERRVLLDIERLKKKENTFLLFYSFLSPCCKCTGREKFNIIDLIKKKVKSDSAFVFTTVYDKPLGQLAVSREKLEESLKELGYYMGGLEKVYRCYRPTNKELECHSCSIQGDIADVCVDNNAAPGQSVKRKLKPSSRSSSSSRSSNRGSGSTKSKIRRSSSSSSIG